LLTLDDVLLASTNGAILFLATAFGVFLALRLTTNYDRKQKRNEILETQKRMLEAIKSELETNQGALARTAKKYEGTVPEGELYDVVPVFLTDSYESAISSGNFSLLKPTVQNRLVITYLNFKQWDRLGDRMIEMYGSQFGDPEKLVDMFRFRIDKKSRSILEETPIALAVLEDELKELKARNGKTAKASPEQDPSAETKTTSPLAVASDKEIELKKVDLVSEELRIRYYTALGVFFSMLIAIVASLISFSLTASSTTVTLTTISFIALAVLVFVGAVVSVVTLRTIREYRDVIPQLDSLILEIERGRSIGTIQEALRRILRRR